LSIIPAAEPPEGALPGGGGYWFTPLPVYLLEAVFSEASPVNAPAAMLWAHIHRNYAWRRRVFPSYATLAEETGQSESAVKRQLSALKAAGALTWGATYGSKGRSSNEYALAPMKPFDFDRAVEVKSDPHPPVQVKNDLGVEVKNEPYPQVKNDLGVKNTVEVRAPLSPHLPKQRQEAPTASDERETTATPTNGKPRTAAQRTVRAAGVVAEADEAAFIAWLTAKCQPRTPGWWRAAAADLPEHAETWRAEKSGAITAPGKPVLQLADWCGRCNDGDDTAATDPARRWINRPDGTSTRCHCHPNAVPAAA
jgi:hypothetical protein